MAHDPELDDVLGPFADAEPTHIAIIERHEKNERRAVMVPPGQSLDFDDGKITRAWLHPYLGREWHLLEFLEIVREQPPKV